MIRFFVFGDLHYGELEDGERRVAELTARARAQKPDFIVSLGDLCPPEEKNRWIREALESVGVPVFHTVGNHDTDKHSLTELLDFLGLSQPYYSFSFGDVQFVVLNTCYLQKAGEILPLYGRNYKDRGDRPVRYPVIPPEELAWLDRELDKGAREGKSCVVFSHHSLVNDFPGRGLYNQAEVRALFQGRDVLLCMNGNDHGDDFRVVDGVPYYLVNSAAYMWCESIVPYRDALSVCVEIDGHELRITGMDSGYITKTPEDAGLHERTWNGVLVAPRTSSCRIVRNSSAQRGCHGTGS